MNAVALTEIVRKFCEGLIKLVYLNILWFFFSLLGAGIFGIVPASVTLCKLQKRWLEEKYTRSITKEFWNYYKKHFFRSNGLAIIMLIIGGIIYFDLTFFMKMEGLVPQMVSIMIFILSVWFMMTLIYIFPIYVSYQLKLLEYIKYAFIIGMLNPLKTVGIAVSLFGIVYLSLFYPQILFSVGISLTFFMIMIISLQAIDHVTVLQEKQAKST
ncbi:YesL family protein [Gracilibacillus massiliensis]|uniref:YesL family protein n=1 Tax=Gracilibacillus massiliensis TaxID=1564956 RepID=UPI00071CD284|nr:DUF624 domain-containing protein [Gracilibacillus massiliensis]